MLFDRLIAVSGTVGTAGFLIYIADASGYVGSCSLLIWRNFGLVQLNWLQVFMASAYGTSVVGVILVALSAAFFMHKAAAVRRAQAGGHRDQSDRDPSDRDAQACSFVAIVLQRVPQRVLQRPEPRLEMPPLVESVAIQRLPHLFRTGGAHAALGLVKLDAAGVELESAEIEQAPYVALQVVDQVLVLDAQNAGPGSARFQ